MPNRSKMQEETAHSWTGVLKLVKRAKRELTKGGYKTQEFWYRGHDKHWYALTPSLLRYEAPEKKQDELFRLYERTLVDNRGHKTHSWETLFDMQEYGIPTRLLDWTTVLGVAAFFAVTDSRDKPCIYVLNPSRLNAMSKKGPVLRVPEDNAVDFSKCYLESPPEEDCYPLALLPTYQNLRSQRQQGRFTAHRLCKDPIEQQVPDSVSRIWLDERACREAKQFMEHSGINAFTVFPDDFGRAQFVRSGADLHSLPYDVGSADAIRKRLRDRAAHDRRVLEAPHDSAGRRGEPHIRGIGVCNLGSSYIHREKEERELIDWLEHDERPVLFVTGEAGIGKTNFVVYCLLDSDELQRKPFVFFSFKLYRDPSGSRSKRQSQGHRLEQYLFGLMLEHNPTEAEEHAARTMIREGDVILALDGLDELARVQGEQAVQAVTREIEDLIGEDAKARVIISCRDHVLKRLKGTGALGAEDSRRVIRIGKFNYRTMQQELRRTIGRYPVALTRLAQIPLFKEMIRCSKDHWRKLLNVGGDEGLLLQWYEIILKKYPVSGKSTKEAMRDIGKIAGLMLQNRSDLLELSGLDAKKRERVRGIVETLSERPFAVFEEELRNAYSFAHQSLREFILAWHFASEVKSGQFDLLAGNPSFDYEGGETYQHVDGLLDFRGQVINKLGMLLAEAPRSTLGWNNVVRNLFELIGMLMPEDDTATETVTRTAMNLLNARHYRREGKPDIYIFYKTMYNIARCLERVHPSAPRKPYYRYILKRGWPRPSYDSIGAWAVRGFHMKKQKPGPLAPTDFGATILDPAIAELEPVVSDCLMSTIENLTDEEIPEDAGFLGINCTLALIRWLPKEPDLGRIMKMLRHPHITAPMKQNIFWALYRRYRVEIPNCFRRARIFEGAGQLRWACKEAKEALRHVQT